MVENKIINKEMEGYKYVLFYYLEDLFTKKCIALPKNDKINMLFHNDQVSNSF